MPGRRKKRGIFGSGSNGSAPRRRNRRSESSSRPVPLADFPPLVFPWTGVPEARLSALAERFALRLARSGVFAVGAVS